VFLGDVHFVPPYAPYEKTIFHFPEMATKQQEVQAYS
jgi:hypothetical protein